MKQPLASVIAVALTFPIAGTAYTPACAQDPKLPDAPKAQLLAQAEQSPQQLGDQQPASLVPPPLPAPPRLPPPTGPKLTLADAEKIALAHNPDVSVAHLLQLAQVQITREARAGEMPAAFANLTAVGAHNNSRITAGALS